MILLVSYSNLVMTTPTGPQRNRTLPRATNSDTNGIDQYTYDTPPGPTPFRIPGQNRRHTLVPILKPTKVSRPAPSTIHSTSLNRQHCVLQYCIQYSNRLLPIVIPVPILNKIDRHPERPYQYSTEPVFALRQVQSTVTLLQ